MTKFQALFIKYLRVRKGYSWRMVDRLYQERYVPKENWWYNTIMLNFEKEYHPELYKTRPHGNQAAGTLLCEEAMETLNENAEDGWN